MPMNSRVLQLIKDAFGAFNAQDMDTVLLSMSPDIRWPQAFGSGYVHGHDAIKRYWLEQWTRITTHIVPVGFNQRGDGALEIIVRQTVKDMQGKLLFDGKVKHLYRIRDGLLDQIYIETI